MKAIFLAASLLAVAAGPVRADEPPTPQSQDSAQLMAGACKAIAAPAAGGAVQLTQDFNTGYCWGAFTSLQSLATAQDEARKPIVQACVPADATRVQLIQAFVHFVDGHPDQAQQDYFPVALAALREAWPCKASHGLMDGLFK